MRDCDDYVLQVGAVEDMRERESGRIDESQ